MEAIFNFGTQYFWLIMIGYTLLLGAMWWRGGAALRAERPVFASSYKRLVTYFIAAGSIPWLLLGAAQFSHEYKYVYEIFDFWNARFWTTGFFISAVILGFAAIYYVFFKHGSKELAEHPGLFGKNLSVADWKLLAASIPIAHLGFFVFAYIMHDKLAAISG